MFIPTDHILKVNVISYNINTGRIFFDKSFWDQYSKQLLRDFYLETGLNLETKQRFFCEVKRSLFEYYYYHIMLKKPMNTSLYQQLTIIFQNHSKNNLPKLIKDFKTEVPIYYDEDSKVSDPVDIDFSVRTHKTDSISASTISISHQLQEIESTYKHTEDRNFSVCYEFDDSLHHFLCEDENINKLEKDYESSSLDQLIDTTAIMEPTFDDIFDIGVRIYHHYDKKIGLPTIMNTFSHSDMRSKVSMLRSPQRFDLWHKNFSHLAIYRSLTYYLGLDICEHLYNEFIRKGFFFYKNGYEYVFCSFLCRDFYNRLTLRRESILPRGFIKLREKIDANKPKHQNIFTSGSSSNFLSSSLSSKKTSVFPLPSSEEKEELPDIETTSLSSSSFGFGNNKVSSFRGFRDFD